MHPPRFVCRGRSLAAFQTVVAALSLAALLILPHTHAAPDTAAVWVADQKQLKRVDPAVNQYVQAIALTNAAEAIAFDAKSNVLWALANKHLLKFSSNGALVTDLDLSPASQSTEALKRLVLDPYDVSLWVAGEKTVLRINTQGQILLKWTSSQNIQAIGLDPDQSLWVLSQNALYQLSPAGTVLNNLAIPNTLMPDPTFLAVDGLGGYLWVAGKKHLFRFDANDLAKSPVAAAVPATVNGTSNKFETLLTHPIFGTVWAASTDTLLLYDRDAGLIRQVNLTPQGLGIPQAIAYEPGSSSLWLGGKTALGRFTPSGDFVAKLPADIVISSIATGPFSVSPTLTLREPINNSVTNNPRPPFRLGLGAECNGASCDLVDAYTQSFTLDATLNGLSIGSLFNLANREALYTPPTRLSEGPNLFSAQAKDVFGHLSNRINGQITIDTISPKFLTLTPADGSTLNAAAVNIGGTVDDPSASVMLQDQAGQALGLASGATFSFAVTLKPGLNTFTLTAQDPVGNASQVGLRLTYLQPIVLTVTSPKDGDTVTTASVTVTGTLVSPAGTTVNVNGVYATLDAAGNFSAGNVPIAAGKNILTVTANAPDGRTKTQTLIIYSLQVNWGTPELIATLPPSQYMASYYPYDLQMAIDGDGNIIVVWRIHNSEHSGADLMSIRYTKGSGWGTAITVASKSTGGIENIRLSVNHQGDGILVWNESTALPQFLVAPVTSLQVAHYKKASGWGSPVKIRSYNPNGGYGPGDPGRPRGFTGPHVAMDGIGNAFALWNEEAIDYSGNGIGSIVKRYEATNSSGRAETMSNIYARGAADGIAADYHGNAIAILTGEDPHYFHNRGRVYAKNYEIGKGWGPEISSYSDISISGLEYSDDLGISKIAMNANGHALVVWNAQNVIYSNQYDVKDKTWRIPQPLNPPAGGGWDQQVSINTSGIGISTWEDDDDGPLDGPEENRRKQNIWVNHYMSRRGWSGHALISQQKFNPYGDNSYYYSPNDRYSDMHPQIAVSEVGTAAVVWQHSDGIRHSIWASYFSENTWYGPALLENSDGPAHNPQVVMDKNGDAIAVWPQWDGTRWKIYSNRFTNVLSGILPVVTPPADVSVEATNVLTPVVLGIASAVDTVDGVIPATPNITAPNGTAGFPVGRNVVIWSATNSKGRTGKNAQMVTVRDTTPPILSVPPALSISVSDANQLPIAVNLGQATATDIFTPVSITNDAPSKFDLGTYTVTWKATDPSGNTTTAQQIVKVIFAGPVYVNVTNIVSGAVVYDDAVTLTGVFQGPPNTGVTVNGVVAITNGENFYVNNLSLKPGENTIKITVTSPDGETFTQTIVVTSYGYEAPIRVDVNPESGFAPFTTRFSISISDDYAGWVKGIRVDFDGDGTTDLTVTGTGGLIAHTYTKPGVYLAKFHALDDIGTVFYTHTHIVVVKDVAGMDAMLRGVYTNMLDLLKAGNIEGALKFVTGGVREKYQNVFTVLQPNLFTVVDQLGTLQGGYIAEKFAEYVITRVEGGKTRGFLIYFLRGEDGVWRIDGV